MARITVEDCLKKVPSRFLLVHLASQRARNLIKGAPPLIKTDNKAVVTALREVAAGLVTPADNNAKQKKGELSE
ncbi:MAG: DNA-directed RNA polymerase subunit omega [Deltaproteobacteria bacterium]|nr:DNA-directed RNA polymerase subunit omega [Deltaproteobacteria bacterium]